MKSFLRDNPTIAFGLGLPLLLVTLFLLLSGLPTLLVAPPQYDLLFATEYDRHQSRLQLAVVNRSVQLTDLGSQHNHLTPRLWRYFAKTGAIQEIAYQLPPAPRDKDKTPTTANSATLIDIPGLHGLIVDSTNIAPDGYVFSLNQQTSGNVFAGLFYSSGYRHSATLNKSGRTIALPDIAQQYYLGSTHFIGWIVSP